MLCLLASSKARPPVTSKGGLGLSIVVGLLVLGLGGEEVQGPLYRSGDRGRRWKVCTLWHKAVLVSGVGQTDGHSVVPGVGELSLSYLGLQIRISCVLQETFFKGGDAISSLVAATELCAY